MMNTEVIKAKKQADIVAYKAGEKSNFLTSYAREELIKIAFEKDNELKKPVTIELSMTDGSYLEGSLAILTKDGNYPKLLEQASKEYKDGKIFFTYKINAKGLEPEYREKLNEKLNISLTIS